MCKAKFVNIMIFLIQHTNAWPQARSVYRSRAKQARSIYRSAAEPLYTEAGPHRLALYIYIYIGVSETRTSLLMTKNDLYVGTYFLWADTYVCIYIQTHTCRGCYNLAVERTITVLAKLCKRQHKCNSTYTDKHVSMYMSAQTAGGGAGPTLKSHIHQRKKRMANAPI